MYGLSWHMHKSDAVAEILIRPLKPWLDIVFIPWDGKNPPEQPPPDIPTCFFEFAPPCQDLAWRNRELSWIPMWDHAALQYDQANWWKALPDKWRILSFSGAAETMARSSEHREVLSVRYHRDPALTKSVDWSGPRTLYYWNRIGLVGPWFIKRLCSALNIEKILFRPLLDPNRPRTRYYELPAAFGNTTVEIVPYHQDKKAYEKQLESVSFVLSPRAIEGVGMVMLDALSRGCAVIAADLPTASEYIQSQENGVLLTAKGPDGALSMDEILTWYRTGKGYLLSDVQDWDKLSAIDWAALGKNARLHAGVLSARWHDQLRDVAEFLGRHPVKGSVKKTTGRKENRSVSSEPLVSICVPNCNSIPYAKELIASIQTQTWKNWEFIVVDFGSTDGSLRLYEQAARQDQRLKIYRESCRGIYPAINAAIARAAGKFIHIAMPEDILHSQGIQIMVEGLLDHPECGSCQTPVVLADRQGRPLPKRKSALERYLGNWIDIPHIRKHPHDAVLFTMIAGFTSATQMLHRREVFDKAGLFPVEYGSLGDFAWYLRMASQFDVLHLPVALAKRRYHMEPSNYTDGLVEHLRSLNHIVNENVNYILENNASMSGLNETSELISSHRLQTFCEAINAAPLYWRRLFAFLGEVIRDPGIVMLLRNCKWDGFLSPKFDGIEEAQNLMNRLGIKGLVEAI